MTKVPRDRKQEVSNAEERRGKVSEGSEGAGSGHCGQRAQGALRPTG